ncbi:MAG: hypothetical protein A2428_16110 [Bdellovibrionales bacterium RIFOXYC1_FULL_54_43]|nr:MAG: hypothetical protein A2428_16110 [Bdellovibrionales bacterium RIFOXYC1_FULL_54_43]OFZ83010.1 MAG: hypothetical protein A2603_02775 [Bdellovibrionales bacterium RIFOXYD1_FULL_55_31]
MKPRTQPAKLTSAFTITRAMLMAAGLGTRLRPFTDQMPKALLPLLGVPMAQFAVDALSAAGVKKIVANVHHHADRARAGLESLELAAAELVISDESDCLLGSAGGLKKALVHFGDEPFFLLNADVIFDVDLGALAKRHAELRSERGVVLTLAVFMRGPAGAKYREIHLDQKSGLINGFGELVAERPYFVGAAVIEREALAEVPEELTAEFVPQVLAPAIQAGKAGAFVTSGLWHDVGTPELWLDAHLAMIERLESGNLMTGFRSRIEEHSQRVGPGIWIAKNSSRGIGAVRWTGPCYWDGLGASSAPPRSFGPRAVLYGSSKAVSDPSTLSGGIGYCGLWVSQKSG